MQNFVITTAGKTLIAEMISGINTLTFTKIETSDHTYDALALPTLTELEDVHQTIQISKVSRLNATTIEVLAAVDNKTLSRGYAIKALGLYAKKTDQTEILFGISIEPDNPDYLAAFSGKTVSSITYHINIKVDAADKVNLIVSPGAFATAEQVETTERAVSTHTSSKIYDELGVHGFRMHEETLEYETGDGNWQRMPYVTGIKGAAETSYRNGEVNLKLEHLGAMSNTPDTNNQYTGNIDELLYGKSGWYWIEPAKASGEQPFDGYYVLEVACANPYVVVQSAYKFGKPFKKYRIWTNNQWYAWYNDMPDTGGHTVSATEPENTNLLWIDTSGSNPVLKYHDGENWVAFTAVWG